MAKSSARSAKACTRADVTLIIMPSEVFHNMSDADVQAIVAYLRSQPARVGYAADETEYRRAFFIGAGVAPTSAQPPIPQPVVAPVEGASAEYGEYLVSILGCRVCHGENLYGSEERRARCTCRAKPHGDRPDVEC